MVTYWKLVVCPLCGIFVYEIYKTKMPQSGHATNFQYVFISVHICFYFVSVAQSFEKLILSVAQFVYQNFF